MLEDPQHCCQQQSPGPHLPGLESGEQVPAGAPSPQGLSDLLMNLDFIEFKLWEPSGPALQGICLKGFSLALACGQGLLPL